jgi:rhodanese-related sulfurtransferase
MTVRTLSPRAAAEYLNAHPGARLVDVRTAPEYREVHAKGTLHIPMERLDASTLEQTVADAPVVLICKSGKRASQCAERIAAFRRAETVVVEGGTEAWLAAGLPVERGPRTISLERQVRIAVGALVLLASVLALTVDPRFAYASAAFGTGLLVAGITDFCGLGMLLARMPWNR